MYYEGGFVGGIAVGDINPDLVWEETINFFPFPTIEGGAGEGAITIGGDVMGAFTDNPGVAEFMQYIASPEGAAAWIAGGTIITPFAGVEPGDYPDERTQAEAQHIADATDARYDGADLLAAGTDLGATLSGILTTRAPGLGAGDVPGRSRRRLGGAGQLGNGAARGGSHRPPLAHHHFSSGG